jgi:hypothetical protein
MFCTQTRTSDPIITLAQVALKKRSFVNGYSYNSRVPEELQGEYIKVISENGLFYQELCDLFHRFYPTPPYSENDFMDFIKTHMGLSCEAVGFTNTQQVDLRGKWHWDNKDRRSFTVWVNDGLPDSAKKVTIIHECFHVIQDVDPIFLDMLGRQHGLLQRNIADRIAEKCAVEMVLPRAEYERCMRKGMTSAQIADSYAVSMALVRNYRS